MLVSIDGKAPPPSGRMGPSYFWLQQFAHFIAQNLHPVAEIVYMDFEGWGFHPTYDSLREMSINILGENLFETIQKLNERRRKRAPSKIITRLCVEIYGQHVAKCVSNIVEGLTHIASFDVETNVNDRRERSYDNASWKIKHLLEEFDARTDKRSMHEELHTRGFDFGNIRPRGESLSEPSPECVAFYDFQKHEINVRETLTAVAPSPYHRMLVIDSMLPDCFPQTPIREGKSKTVALDFITLMETSGGPRRSAQMHVKFPATQLLDTAAWRRMMDGKRLFTFHDEVHGKKTK